jgi:CRISPR-associated protein Cmr4
VASTKIYWLHTLSPTHVGTGRGVGYIDLPIHRDKVTNWPVIPGSAFKGVWADHFRATDDNRKKEDEEGRMLRAAFGRGSDDSSNAGSLVPTDARLVCLPVRSFQGTFAWCTSPLALKMLHRDLTLAGMSGLPSPPEGVQENAIHHAHNTALKEGEQVFLEDLDFRAQKCDIADAWAAHIADRVFTSDPNWREAFIRRFAVLSDVVFDFLTQTGTEVAARVRIDDDTKTVADGHCGTRNRCRRKPSWSA